MTTQQGIDEMMHTEERGRISARVSLPIAERLQEAADLTGATLNQFLVQSALEKANKIFEAEKVIYYSLEDAAMFLTRLDNPSPPNDRLARARERYSTKVSNAILNNKAESAT
jgi:uncharacterized protein (DUF1778 family)